MKSAKLFIGPNNASGRWQDIFEHLKLNDLLEELDISIVKNGNITVGDLGSKGHHLNLQAIGKFPMNFKASAIGQ